MSPKLVVEFSSDVKAAFEKLSEVTAQIRERLDEMENRIDELEDKVG